MAYQPAVVMPTLEEALQKLTQLPDDIKLIRQREGLGLTQLARSLGASKTGLWYWQTGKRTPREPLIILGLIIWAERLRNTTS